MNEHLIYVPLGGAGEIGMNLYLYGYGPKGRERFIIVDVGVSFPNNDTSPGADLIMADPSYILERRDRVEAVFLTHAHEDHIGAIGMILRDLGDVPIFTRAFTAEISREKLKRFDLDPKQITVCGTYPEYIEAGAFKVAFVPISHSIPESSGLVIEVDSLRVFHTGDFKLDTTPIIGEKFDAALFKSIGDLGVDAMVCDSTNVFSQEKGRSEAILEDPIHGLIAGAKGLVVATTFGSNVARIQTLARAAERAKRRVIVVGASMERMLRAAKKTGLLSEMPAWFGGDDYEAQKRNETMVICTGSQGEYHSASGFLSRGGFMNIKLEEGDLFLYSSKVIPGNERAVGVTLNNLARQGADVIVDDGRYHVSGHANQPDLVALQELVRPTTLIPMHGEYRHLREHVKIARKNGMASVLASNGTVVKISKGRVEIIDEIETGRYYLDGKILISGRDGILRDRLNMASNGQISALLGISEDGSLLESSWVVLSGLASMDQNGVDIAKALEDDIDSELSRINVQQRKNDSAVEAAILKVLNRSTRGFYDKKPLAKIFISRFS